MNKLQSLLVLGAMALPCVPVWAQAAPALKGCASHTPPFMIFKDKKAEAGFSYELFLEIARQLGRSAEVSALPWARCLQEVKAGRIDMAIDAYGDAQRRKTYWYSTPYYTLTPQVFFRSKSSFTPASAGTASTLKAYRGCGVREYTYEHYGLDANAMDRGAPDDRSMLLKLNAGHCDYAVEELEYIVGGRNYVPNWLDESELKSFRPAWAKGPQTHFLIGKERHGAENLLRQVNQAIAASDKSGLTASLAKRYLEAADKPPKKP